MSVVVIDETPYLVANDPGFEGSLQKSFERERTHTLIGRAAGDMPTATLGRSLRLIADARAGVDVSEVTALTPDDLLAAWTCGGAP